jgi:hypothetical protein
MLHSQSRESRFRTIFMNTSECSVLLKNMYLIGDRDGQGTKALPSSSSEIKTSAHRGDEEVVRFFVCSRR